MSEKYIKDLLTKIEQQISNAELKDKFSKK
jgi:hypothetical protein